MSSSISGFGNAVTTYQESNASADIQEQNARLEYMEAIEATKKVRDEVKEISGEQKVLYAKAGVDITSGSPLVVMKRTREKGALKMGEIQSKAAVKYQMAKDAAKMTKKAGMWSAISQGVSAVGNLATSAMGGYYGQKAGGTTGGISGFLNPSYGFGSYIESLNKKQLT